MGISVRELRLPEERDLLASWLSSESWPFHTSAHLTIAQVNNLIDSGAFSGPDTQTFWVFTQNGERAGLIRIFDLEDIDDGNPLFDLRIKCAYRMQGIGRAALRWMTNYLFEQYPQLNRIEGNTRADNAAMRRVFRACGYVKEGYFREGWPVEDGRRFDTVHYGILRRDWETGTTTPVPQDDA